MKAILIARVSTEEQKEAGNSLPAQIIRLENYCKNRGFEILKLCSFDESAYKNQRVEFDSIVEFHNKHYDLLIKEQKNITRKLDNLYEDKLDAKISEEQYQTFHQKFKEQKEDISIRLERLHDAEDNYYITAKYLLDLSNRAGDFLKVRKWRKRGNL